jgi:xylulokinase
VPDAGETVATGAAAQAAAIVEGETPDGVAVRWALGAGTTIEPINDVGDVRQRYADLSRGP